MVIKRRVRTDLDFQSSEEDIERKAQMGGICNVIVMYNHWRLSFFVVREGKA